jgi:hypothetical protein
MVIFTVNYHVIGRNSHPHFSTLAAMFNQPKTDYKTIGQCQEEVLPRNSVAHKFYQKWDKCHGYDLTQEQYDEMAKDLEELKEVYNWVTITYNEFLQNRELSMMKPKKVLKS